MTAFRVVRGGSVLYLDTPLGPQLHKPNIMSACAILRPGVKPPALCAQEMLA
jgi:hypothetical protein